MNTKKILAMVKKAAGYFVVGSAIAASVVAVIAAAVAAFPVVAGAAIALAGGLLLAALGGYLAARKFDEAEVKELENALHLKQEGELREQEQARLEQLSRQMLELQVLEEKQIEFQEAEIHILQAHLEEKVVEPYASIAGVKQVLFQAAHNDPALPAVEQKKAVGFTH